MADIHNLGMYADAAGAEAFTELTDTPTTYVGQAGKVPKVAVAENALEFASDATGDGDVTGPSSAGNLNLAMFNGATGKIIADSTKDLSDITQEAFKTITFLGSGSQADVVADHPTDTLIFKAGVGITIESNAGQDEIEFSISSGNDGDVDGPGVSVDDRIATFDGTTGKKIQDGGKTIGQLGDVDGPSSSTNSNIALFSGTTGKIIADGGKDLNDLAQAAFKTVKVSGQSDVVADVPNDDLTLVAGANLAITTNAGTDSITFAVTGSGSSEWTDTGNILHPADSSGSLDSVVIGGTTKGNSDIVLDVDGSAVFNEQGQEVDFRVEALGTSRMICTDGSNASVVVSDRSTAPNLGTVFGVDSITKFSKPFPVMTSSQAAGAVADSEEGAGCWNKTTSQLDWNYGGTLVHSLMPNGANCAYVSAMGNDALDGLSVNKPKLTIAAALVVYNAQPAPRKLILLGQSKFTTAVPIVVTKGGEIDLNGSWVETTGSTAGQDLLRIDYDDVKGIWIHGGLLQNQYGPCITIKKAYEPIIRDCYFYQPGFVQVNTSTDAGGGSNRQSVVALNCSSNAASSRVSGIFRDNTVMRQWGTITIPSSPGAYTSMIRMDSNGKGDAHADVKFNDWIIDGNVIYETCAGSGFDTNTGGLDMAGIRVCEQGANGDSAAYGLNNMPTCYSHNNQYTIDMNPRGNTEFTGHARFSMFASVDRYSSVDGDNTMKMKIVSNADLFRCEWSTKTSNASTDKTPRITAFYQWGDVRSHSKKDCRYTFTSMTVDTGLGRLDDTTSDGSAAINCGAFSTDHMAWCFWAGDGGANFNVSLANCHWNGTAGQGRVYIRELTGTASFDERVNIWAFNVSDDSPYTVTGLNDNDTGNSATYQVVPTMTVNTLDVADGLTTAKRYASGAVAEFSDFRMADANHNNSATTGSTFYNSNFESGWAGPMVFKGGGSYDTIKLDASSGKLNLTGQYGQIKFEGANSNISQLGTSSACVVHSLIHNGDMKHYGSNYSRHQMLIGSQQQWTGLGTVPSYGTTVRFDGASTSYVYGIRKMTVWSEAARYIGVCWNGYSNSAGAQDGNAIKWGASPHMMEGTMSQHDGAESSSSGNYITDGTADRWTIAISLWGKVSSSTGLLECQVGPWVEIY